jgi:uncharacterized protein (UPF0147 family)
MSILLEQVINDEHVHKNISGVKQNVAEESNARMQKGEQKDLRSTNK